MTLKGGRRARRLVLIWVPLLVTAAVGGWLWRPSGAIAAAATAGAPAPAASRGSGSSAAPLGAGGVPADVLYQQDCASCHGETGKGTSRGPDLTGVGEAAVDFMLSTGRMPKRGAASNQPPYRPSLPEADIKALDQYVTELAAKGGPTIPSVEPVQGDQAKGHILFDENCAACHNSGGSGGILYSRVVPSITGATPTQIGEAMRVGPGPMPVFGPHQLTQSEVNDIASYILSAQHPADQGGDPISHIGPAAEGAVIWLVAITGLLFMIRWIGERG
ncbi:MAG: c-type cytochrome [Acidobacteriota bacterium]|nr:c-type cytochrome [Acidobacteriota bacterium]